MSARVGCTGTSVVEEARQGRLETS